MIEIIVMVTIGVVALILSLGLGIHFANKSSTKLMPLIIMLLAVSMLTSNIVSDRDITLAGIAIGDLGDGNIYSVYLNKLLNLVFIGLAFVGIIDRVFTRARAGLPWVHKGNWLFLIILFSATNGLTSAFLGAHTGFTPGLLIPLFILVFLVIDDQWKIEDITKSGRNAFFLIILISFVALVLRPTLVLEKHYHGFLPLIDFRYWGLAAHANALGPIAVVYLMLCYLSPYRAKWLNWVGLMFAIVTLLLTQSKTALIGGGLTYFVIELYRLVQGSKPKHSLLSWQVLDILRLIFFIFGLLGIVIVIFYADFSKLDAVATGGKLETLSGRTKIWEVAIQEWRANPIFGYGPGLFDLEHRINIGMNYAFHAHNQFLQTLAQSGIVGSIGLSALLLVGMWQSIEKATETKGVTVAIYLFLFLRCFTEVPLRSGAFLSGEFILLMVWLAMLMSSNEKVSTSNKDIIVRK